MDYISDYWNNQNQNSSNIRRSNSHILREELIQSDIISSGAEKANKLSSNKINKLNHKLSFKSLKKYSKLNIEDRVVQPQDKNEFQKNIYHKNMLPEQVKFIQVRQKSKKLDDQYLANQIIEESIQQEKKIPDGLNPLKSKSLESIEPQELRFHL
jgi:hypothetical protein